MGAGRSASKTCVEDSPEHRGQLQRCLLTVGTPHSGGWRSPWLGHQDTWQPGTRSGPILGIFHKHEYCHQYLSTLVSSLPVVLSMQTWRQNKTESMGLEELCDQTWS